MIKLVSSFKRCSSARLTRSFDLPAVSFFPPCCRCSPKNMSSSKDRANRGRGICRSRRTGAKGDRVLAGLGKPSQNPAPWLVGVGGPLGLCNGNGQRGQALADNRAPGGDMSTYGPFKFPASYQLSAESGQGRRSFLLRIYCLSWSQPSFYVYVLHFFSCFFSFL